eukprot:TRINITY_DN18002_c0_g1_i1.p2 TRINITY_DN18002_c0_g1~~TRINITY_DN18002_c0_g1_i1.p2  ORF type:complete len:298 (-),score=41.75 TRINITY_DN18002_c0_g1_i1:1622-2515(-)
MMSHFSILFAVCLIALWCLPTQAHYRLSDILLCEACKAVATEIARDIKDHEKETGSVQAGGRLGADHKPVRKQWKTSELRATELLESLCSSKLSSYNLRQDKETNNRVFSKDYSETKSVDHYTPDEKSQFRDASKDLEWTCSYMVDEHYDELIAAIRAEQSYETLSEWLCNTTNSFCHANKLEPFYQKVAEARAKWEKAEAKKKKKKAKEEAKRKKKEQEEREAREKQEREEAEAAAKLDALEAQEEAAENAQQQEAAEGGAAQDPATQQQPTGDQPQQGEQAGEPPQPAPGISGDL